MASEPVDGTADVVSGLGAWFKQPFSSQMSVTGWALFTGLILVLCILWAMVLHELRGEL